MLKKFQPVIAILLLAIAGFLWFTRGAEILKSTDSPDQKYVDATVGAAYQGVSETASLDQAKARAFLRTAEQAKPENAYTDYLRASVAAKEGDTAGATKALLAGNAKKEVIHYILELPAHENESSLSVLRALSNHGEKLASDKGEDAGAFFDALRVASYRIIGLEPITTLSVAAGVSLINQVYSDGITHFTKSAPETAKAWEKDRAAFKAWSKIYREKQSTQLGNVISEVGKEAGLSKAEIEDVALKKPLADTAKQAKVDELMAEVVVKEQKLLRDIVSDLPKIESKQGNN
ncbi:MAG: hypothetical protein ACOYON_07760 [Fimbriimonas sp.]